MRNNKGESYNCRIFIALKKSFDKKMWCLVLSDLVLNTDEP